MDDAPPEVPALPLVLSVPEVAAGADAGDCVAGEGLVVVAPLLGEVVLGVVVVLGGLPVSFLPHPYSATARSANTKACFTISVTSNVTVGRTCVCLICGWDASAMPEMRAIDGSRRESR